MAKRTLVFFIITFILAQISWCFAEVVGYEAGIIGNPLLKIGTYEFTEVTFISGEPITLTGTITVPTLPTTGQTKYTAAYTFDLSNVQKNITLSRKATYTIVVSKDDAMSQTTSSMTLTKLDEVYTVNGVSYTLARYTYNQSTLADNTPAVDYFNGDLYADRVFYKNGDAKKNDGILTITSSAGAIVGYKHKWGSAETRVINQKYNYIPSSSTGTVWSGTVRTELSAVDKKSFQYKSNDPQSISFKGSYIMNENVENILKYTYDMPLSGVETSRNKGSQSMKKNIVLGSTSLVAPKIRDIGGYWAQKDVFLLASLKVFDEYDRLSAAPGYFSPNIYCTRLDYAKAVARSIGDVKPLTKDEIIKRDRPGFQKMLSFQDIDVKNPDISYLEFLQAKHVIFGEGQYFYPDRPITRAEATTMMISALGLSGLAPQPPYQTDFKDDKQLPNWAKDYIYAAKEVGLMKAYKDGTFKADSFVTRGEAASYITAMINHIRENITADYREKVLNH